MKQYDVITAILRSYLINDSNILAWDGWTTAGQPDIYPAYITYYDNPNYPAITICRDYGLTDKQRTGYQELRYYVHGWFKPQSADDTRAFNTNDCAALYNMVVNALDVSPIFGYKIKEFAMCRMIDSQLPLYESDTRTTYFMTQWLIKANKNLMND
ncbi:hypothetical protein [Pectinatus frisingensis]|uniref:hypothetical protein n=1 Tax=Pectinatus frisingensis TaxID=865 RepID=UPI0018C49AC1|nr:hypothetical protein [Pectinatus frisingensis]